MVLGQGILPMTDFHTFHKTCIIKGMSLRILGCRMHRTSETGGTTPGCDKHLRSGVSQGRRHGVVCLQQHLVATLVLHGRLVICIIPQGQPACKTHCYHREHRRHRCRMHLDIFINPMVIVAVALAPLQLPQCHHIVDNPRLQGMHEGKQLLIMQHMLARSIIPMVVGPAHEHATAAARQPKSEALQLM